LDISINAGMKIPLHPCYILHTRKYRETSLLLQIFSKDYGRIDLIAKGARRNKNSKRFLYRPFQRLQLSWNIRGELGTLTQIETDSSIIIHKPQHIMSGFYINEIVIRLLHKHESHPDLFEAYNRVLINLAKDQPGNIVLRYFEKRLLKSLGYGLVLEHEVNSGVSIEPDSSYYYQFEMGPLQSKPEGAGYLKVSGKALLALHDETINPGDETVLKETKLLMRSVLATYLGNKPLASRELYHAYLNEYAS